ncbi:hypothetical protein OKW29_000108 [Paraburkholderia sp. CI3]
MLGHERAHHLLNLCCARASPSQGCARMIKATAMNASQRMSFASSRCHARPATGSGRLTVRDEGVDGSCGPLPHGASSCPPAVPVHVMTPEVVTPGDDSPLQAAGRSLASAHRWFDVLRDTGQGSRGRCPARCHAISCVVVSVSVTGDGQAETLATRRRRAGRKRIRGAVPHVAPQSGHIASLACDQTEPPEAAFRNTAEAISQPVYGAECPAVFIHASFISFVKFHLCATNVHWRNTVSEGKRLARFETFSRGSRIAMHRSGWLCRPTLLFTHRPVASPVLRSGTLKPTLFVY